MAILTILSTTPLERHTRRLDMGGLQSDCTAFTWPVMACHHHISTSYSSIRADFLQQENSDFNPPDKRRSRMSLECYLTQVPSRGIIADSQYHQVLSMQVQCSRWVEAPLSIDNSESSGEPYRLSNPLYTLESKVE